MTGANGPRQVVSNTSTPSDASDCATGSYETHQRIHQARSAGDAREQLVGDWLAARGQGAKALMVAAHLRDVDDLNHRARTALQAGGEIGPDQIVLAGRPYAIGDEVLALRNDYGLGVLNGTHAVIEDIDHIEAEFRLRCEDGTCLRLPFSYALEAGLTHGYATTVHKAQGQTVDACFVLLDDTTSREHAYTAFSRGRHANHLYAVTDDDRRVDERHATEIEPDSLDEIRRAVQRSLAKHLAIDTTHQPGSPLDAKRRERDHLRATLADAPHDSTWEWDRLFREARTEEARRSYAVKDKDAAERDLRALGAIGRRLHPTRREAIEDRIDKAATTIARHDERLTDLTAQLHDLEPDLQVRRAWEREHAPELRRLEAIEHQIDATERLDHVAARSAERSLEHDPGLSL